MKATISGSELELDFSGSSDQVDGNLNCPSVGDSLGRLLLRTGPARPRRAAVRRGTPPGGGQGTARLGPERQPGRRRRRRERRDIQPRGGPGVRRARGAMRQPRPGAGHHEQPDAGRKDEEWTYYETIGGGQGACPDADGPSAIHVAMSNTLNTPTEALETELPLRVRELVRPARLRWRGRARRRRRRSPRDRGARADDLQPDHRAPAPPAARR